MWHLLAQVHYRGVIVDLRTTPVTITHMPEWDRQVVLLVSDKGAELKEWTGDAGDLAALIDAAKKLLPVAGA